MDNQQHELEILLTTAAKVKAIEDSLDKHLNQVNIMHRETMDKIDKNFDHTEKKLDQLTENLTKSRIEVVEKHGALKAKLAGLSAFIAIIISFVTSFIHDRITK